MWYGLCRPMCGKCISISRFTTFHEIAPCEYLCSELKTLPQKGVTPLFRKIGLSISLYSEK
jgi:hypothetical protein